MATGFGKHGYIGWFPSEDVLLSALAANKCRGNMASVGLGANLALYFSNGEEWSNIGTVGQIGLPNIVVPTNVPYNGSVDATLSTEALQDALDAAKSAVVAKDATHDYGYGYGGKVVMPCGVLRTGPVTFSRSVSIEGSGALASSTVLSDYSSLNGVAGEDSLFTCLDDGTADGGITQQNKMTNYAIDGMAEDAPVGHVRHGINYTNPDDGTDRIASATDFQIMNFPGAGWKVFANGQIRGSNFKATGNQWGIHWEKVKDGKFDQIGLGKNISGNQLIDCASLKLSKVDIWTGPTSDGSPVLTMNSCAKTMISDGEIEGLVYVMSTNNDDDDKSYREQQTNVFQNINFKVSQDWYDAAGAGNIATGAGYVALIKVVDANNIRLANCAGKYKLGLPESATTARYLEYTPNLFVWFGTQVDSSDPQYDDWLEASGDVDITGTTLLWHAGKGTPGKRSIPIPPFKEHISNCMPKVKGLRVGTVSLKRTGTQNLDEVELDGSSYTSDYYPLLYLWTDPDWGNLAGPSFSLLDRDGAGPGADPDTGYVTFTVPDWSASASAISTLIGESVSYYVVYEQ